MVVPAMPTQGNFLAAILIFVVFRADLLGVISRDYRQTSLFGD